MANKLNENYIDNIVKRIINETASERAEQIENMLMGKETEEGDAFTAALAKTKKGGKFKLGNKTFTDTSDYNDGELDEENEVCECGGTMREGECTECGKSWMNEDYEDLDVMDFEDDEENQKEANSETCKYHEDNFGPDHELTRLHCRGIKDLAKKPFSKFEMNEKLYGGQRKLDHNKNNRIDSEDLRMARDKKAKHKESITMTESEMIDFIESIVTEEKLKSMGKPKGMATYEKAHRGSGKENEDYIKSVSKKMKDYLKDASMGDYETEPEIFPKGNGKLKKMNKKAYVPSDAVQDYIDNLTAAGQENLDYDEIHPSEDWISANIEGSSMTGNNPEWANTGKSEVNKKRNKIRKDNMLAKIKRKAYNKAPQPILQDNTGEDNAGKLMMKLESTNEKEKQKLNEEFDKMKRLLNYNKKTQ